MFSVDVPYVVTDAGGLPSKRKSRTPLDILLLLALSQEIVDLLPSHEILLLLLEVVLLQDRRLRVDGPELISDRARVHEIGVDPTVGYASVERRSLLSH